MPRKPSPSPDSSPIPPLHIRPDARAVDALQRAQRATGGALSTHRVALASLTLGARMIEADPSLMFKLAAEGAERVTAPRPGPEREPSPAPPPPAATRPRSARTAPGGPSVGVGPNARAKASPVEVESASAAIRRARAAGHGTAALIRAAKVQSTGGARETLRDLAADPRPVRTYTASLVRALTAGALVLSPAPS